MKDFRRNFAPKTSISFSYGYEYTPYYTRSVVNARFGYLWRLSNKRWRYNFDLIDLNYVLMKNVNRSFVDSLKNEYIKNTYTDHMIFSAVFSATYTDQIVNSKEMSYNYFRANLESSGNLLGVSTDCSGRGERERIGMINITNGWVYVMPNL